MAAESELARMKVNPPNKDKVILDMQCEVAKVVPHREQTWQMVTEKFRFASDEEEIDIYQMCAWMSERDSIPTPKKYFYYFKAFICWAIQVPGLIIFLVVQFGKIFSADSGLGFCAMRQTVREEYTNLVHILAALFGFYISAKMGGMVDDIGKQGLYNMNFWNGCNCPPFVRRHWVFMGGYTNVTATLLAVYGSFCVLYASNDIMDVVLDAIALFFMLDVDDYILDRGDYQRLQDWFQKEYNEKQWEECEAQMTDMKIMASCCAKVMTVLHFGFTGIGFFGVFVAPFWLAICY